MREETIENPYLNARREWNERYGEYIQAAYHWKLIAMGSIAAAIISISGAVYIGSRSKFVPYIVEVDPKGHILNTAAVDQGQRPDQRIVQTAIADWINYHRSVVNDSIVQRQYIEKTYAYVTQGSPAKVNLDSWYSAGANPFKRIETESVTVEVSSVLLQSKNSYQVEWTEKSFEPNGKPLFVQSYRALLSVEFRDVEMASLQKNPLGLFFTSISIQKIGV